MTRVGLGRVLFGGCVALALGLGLSCGQPQSQNARRGDLQWLLSEEQGPVRQTELDFGEVAVGSAARRTFLILNEGSDRAVVTAVRFEEASPGSFFVQAPDAVPAEGQRTMSVTFAPSQPGNYEARLVVEHDGFTLSAAMNLKGVAR